MWARARVCVCLNCRYIFLFYCYLFYARRLSSFKVKAKKINIALCAMQTTVDPTEEKRRVNWCVLGVACENPLIVSDRFSSHVPNNINTPSTRMDKHTHIHIECQQFNKPCDPRPATRTHKKWMEEGRWRTKNEQFHISLPCSFVLFFFFHILLAQNDSQYEYAFFFLSAQNQTVKSQWVKHTYHRWEEKNIIECVSANSSGSSHHRKEQQQEQPQRTESKREKSSIGNKKEASEKSVMSPQNT